MLEFPVLLEHPDVKGRTTAGTPSSLRVMQTHGWRPVNLSPDLDSMKRAELEEHARTVGVVEPEKLPNIQKVKDAIAAATADLQSDGGGTEAAG